MLDPSEIKKRIEGAIANAEIDERDLTGTGDHFEARVVSPLFAGKTMIEQHQLVYAPLQEWLKTGELHALALKTFTPEQWQRQQSRRP